MSDVTKKAGTEIGLILSIGRPALLEQLAEECAELAQAALKLARLERGENPTPKSRNECLEDLAEEAADVNLCMGVLTYAGVLDSTKFYLIAGQKRERWARRIKEIWKNG